MSSLYKFSASKKVDNPENIAIMNYNVRLFNLYNWIKEDNVQTKITEFITQEDPDIVSFQEYNPHDSIFLPNFAYKYENLSGKRTKYGHAIYSKFPIVNSGSFEFENTGNNAIFIDIVNNNDTLRIYNLHLQSARIDPNSELKSEDSERLFRRVANTFEVQQTQAETFIRQRSFVAISIIQPILMFID